MAKVSAVDKNKKRIAMTAKEKSKRDALKKIIMNKELSIEDRVTATQKLSKLSRNSSAVRIRNRCSLTGRPRGNYRFFGLSRIMLRELASFGKLPGVVKASW